MGTWRTVKPVDIRLISPIKFEEGFILIPIKSIRGIFMDDAKAKIQLADGREIWRQVKVEYREVGTGRWVSAEEVEHLYPAGWEPDSPEPGKKKLQPEQLRQQIVDVQAQIALDANRGSKSTSAARLVLKALENMENENQDELPTPWFILGRNLAEEVLMLIEQPSDQPRG